MSRLFKYVFVLMSLYSVAQDNQNLTYAPLSTIITDLNNDQKSDTLSVYMPPLEGNPGTFGRITVSLGNKGRNTFKAQDIWDKVDNEFAKRNINAIPSELVFIRKEPKQTYILLFGFAYGSGREEISIIRIKDNKIEILFDNPLEEPIKFADLDNDGEAELIARAPPEIYSIDEKTKAGIGAYSPFIVFKLNSVMYTDKKLTEQYNKQHYVWAGYKYNENIKVRYPEKGKPEIIN